MTRRNVFLILTDTGTLFTKMIKMYTKKPFNHASISFDPTLTTLYSFGRKNPRNPFIGGFTEEQADDGLMKTAKCAIYRAEVTEDQYLKMKNYIENIKQEKHLYRYNLLGLFAIILNKKLTRHRSFFCSQFVSTVLQQGNVGTLEKEPCFVTPNDLALLPEFTLVFKGDLKEYRERMGEHYRRPFKKVDCYYSFDLGA